MKLSTTSRVILGLLGTLILVVSAPFVLAVASVPEKISVLGGNGLLMAAFPILTFLPLGWGLAATRFFTDTKQFEKIKTALFGILIFSAIWAGISFTITVFKNVSGVTALIPLGLAAAALLTCGWGRYFANKK